MWICSAATITSFICLFIKDKIAAVIALSVFCLLLLAIAVFILIFVWQHLKRTHHEYITHAAYVKYETEIDGKNINFETYRQIQCKQLIMHELKYAFKWSGTKIPIITSKLQKTDGKIFSTDAYSYDHVNLNLKQALVYNEDATIHFHATMDDVDNASMPFVEFKVETPTQIVHFRVILKHKADNYSEAAVLKRRKINTQTGSANYEVLQTVPFVQKVYEHHLLEPEVGYFYRIEWDK